MKKLLLLITFLLVASYSFGQNNTWVYADIREVRGSYTSATSSYIVDIGARIPCQIGNVILNEKSIICDINKEQIVFNGTMAVLNYLVSDGWEFVHSSAMSLMVRKKSATFDPLVLDKLLPNRIK